MFFPKIYNDKKVFAIIYSYTYCFHRCAKWLYLNDVDALIVADFGLINLFKNRYPDLAIHVSTQFNTHNLWQVKLLEQL